MCTFLVGLFGYTCWTSKNHGVHYKKKSPLLLNTDTKFEFWCFKPNKWPYQSPLSEGLFQNIDRARALWGGLDWRAGTDMLLVAKPSFLPGGMKLAKLHSHTAHVHTRTNVDTHRQDVLSLSSQRHAFCVQMRHIQRLLIYKEALRPPLCPASINTEFEGAEKKEIGLQADLKGEKKRKKKHLFHAQSDKVALAQAGANGRYHRRYIADTH